MSDLRATVQAMPGQKAQRKDTLHVLEPRSICAVPGMDKCTREGGRMCTINYENCKEKDTCTICKIKKDVIEEMSETYPDIDLYFER